MYLENIFAAPDIRMQLPSEMRKFNIVDKFWKNLMEKTKKRPNVEINCSNKSLHS